MSWFADSMQSQLSTQVESGAIVAAGAVVSPGRTVPSGEVWAGAPAKRLRALEPEEAGFLAQAASDYAALAAVHAAENAKSLEEILARPVVCIHMQQLYSLLAKAIKLQGMCFSCIRLVADTLVHATHAQLTSSCNSAVGGCLATRR